METEVKKYQVAKYKKRITRASQNMGIKQAKGNSSELIAINEKGVIEEEPVYTAIVDELSNKTFLIRFLAVA